MSTRMYLASSLAIMVTAAWDTFLIMSVLS